MNRLTNGALIEVESTGERYHTLTDWGLAIGNNDYIGDVEQENYYIDVPGADGFLDFSEVTTGRRIFKSRPIQIKLGGKKPRNDWDLIISDLRNKIEGRKIRVIFDNDAGYYWTGRAAVKDFDRNREIGTFTLSIPKADPYKYSIVESTEDWLWDPFDFEEGIIDEGTRITLDANVSTQSHTILADNTPFVPVIHVDRMGDTGIVMTVNGERHTLLKGKNRFADIVVYQDDITLVFEGKGELTVEYRRRSL